jgi:phosphopantothenoylcysteine synthetase/decarboxylase
MSGAADKEAKKREFVNNFCKENETAIEQCGRLLQNVGVDVAENLNRWQAMREQLLTQMPTKETLEKTTAEVNQMTMQMTLALCDAAAQRGARAMRYCGFDSLAEFAEQTLSAVRTKASSIQPVTKELIRDCAAQMDTAAFVMIHAFSEWLSFPGERVCVVEFAPAIDHASVDYARSFSKALDAKQKHAPGFDGVGGGASRQ